MTLLIVGAEGQLGSCVINELDNSDISYIAVGKKDLDISSKKAVHDFIEINRPSVVINCAAYTAVDLSEDHIDAAFAVNSLGPKNLASACKNSGIRFIHISTDYVFSGESSVPYNENDTVSPINVYGQSKLEGENYIRSILKEHIIIRVSWLFSEYGNNFLKTMLRVGAVQNKLSIVSDQFGSPTYAGDLASLVILLSKKVVGNQFDCYGTYHFSNKGVCSWFDFAEEIFIKAHELGLINHIPNLEPIKTVDYPTRAKRPNFSKLDTAKIESTFDIKIPTWKDSLYSALINLTQAHEYEN